MEIVLEENLTSEQESLLEMHSVLNVMGVLTYEYMMLKELLGDSEELEGLIEENVQVGEILRNRARAICLIGNIANYIHKVRTLLAEEARRQGMHEHPEYQSRVRNINCVFDVLEVRAAEIMYREQAADPWCKHEIGQLKQNFFAVFRAIERNSHGGYRIVHNVAAHNEGDYLVNFEINSELGEYVWMPLVFQDVMRDLMANARKYTPPGGEITAGLFQDRECLRFVVMDNGVGIPSNEIINVVKFGYRASNVTNRVTRGGGFGLTKAFYVTRKFGGKMWVHSTGVPGAGTRIEIQIPFSIPADGGGLLLALDPVSVPFLRHSLGDNPKVRRNLRENSPGLL